MMAVILQVDFPSNGPFGAEMATAYRELAASINQEPGLIWKIWTENSDTQQAGGIYLFDTKHRAEQYLQMHTARLQSFGIDKIHGKIFEINTELSVLNQAAFLASSS
nr:monooxygenase [Acinetobacter indicus]